MHTPLHAGYWIIPKQQLTLAYSLSNYLIVLSDKRIKECLSSFFHFSSKSSLKKGGSPEKGECLWYILIQPPHKDEAIQGLLVTVVSQGMKISLHLHNKDILQFSHCDVLFSSFVKRSVFILAFWDHTKANETKTKTLFYSIIQLNLIWKINVLIL